MAFWNSSRQFPESLLVNTQEQCFDIKYNQIYEVENWGDSAENGSGRKGESYEFIPPNSPNIGRHRVHDGFYHFRKACSERRDIPNALFYYLDRWVRYPYRDQYLVLDAK
jgi:hypothetical protein